MRKRKQSMRSLVMLSVIFGIVFTVASYGIPGHGILISIPASGYLYDIGGYPFVIAISQCAFSTPSTAQSCGQPNPILSGIVIDILFWAALSFIVIYFAGKRERRS